jgi:hypothetical protein
VPYIGTSRRVLGVNHGLIEMSEDFDDVDRHAGFYGAIVYREVGLDGARALYQTWGARRYHVILSRP